jgi:hypothetical protein
VIAQECQPFHCGTHPFKLLPFLVDFLRKEDERIRVRMLFDELVAPEECADLPGLPGAPDSQKLHIFLDFLLINFHIQYWTELASGIVIP